MIDKHLNEILRLPTGKNKDFYELLVLWNAVDVNLYFIRNYIYPIQLLDNTNIRSFRGVFIARNSLPLHIDVLKLHTIQCVMQIHPCFNAYIG